MSEIDKLRADLEVLKRYEPMVYSLAAARAEIENKIARLEAEADPWRKHNELMDVWRRTPAETHSPHRLAVELVDHLTAELASLIVSIPAMEDALEDMLGGWLYIRQVHGDLFGVGWDRCEEKARAALQAAKGGGE